ncbi:MAG: hypothetical protein L0Y71_00600 [Gemmataceae bacterium]|nr:hypothetical protein [Gemmataceae bacterium]
MFGAAFSRDGKFAAISGRKDNCKEYGLLVWDLEKHELVREWDPGPRYFGFVGDDLAVLKNGEVEIHRFMR